MIEDGLADRLQPEVLAGLAALSRVSRALVGTGELPVLAGAALDEMREALRLDRAVLYLPDADGQPVLRRYVGDEAAPELSFDEEAWRLVSGAPIVLREPAGWLVANPFTPPARDWVILPLVSERCGDRERARADRDRPAQRHGAEPAVHAALGRDHDRAAAARAAGGGDGARAAHAGRRGPRRARPVPRGGAPRAVAAGARLRAPARGGRVRPPARPRAAAGALHRHAGQPARGDRRRRAPRPRRRARERARRRRAGDRHARVAGRERGAGERRRARPGARGRDPLRGHRHAAGGHRRRRRPRVRSRDARRASRTAISG